MIKVLDEFFTSMGWPITLRSDGGPYFSAKIFEDYCNRQGVRHSKSAPGHHESNGGAECGIREIKLLMKTTQATGLPWKKLILQLNNMNRACDTGSPNQLFFCRVVRTPGIPTLGREEIDYDKLA